MAAENVGQIVFHTLTSRRPRRRYAPAQHPLLEQILPRITPARMSDFIVEHALGLVDRSRRSSR
jgi:hypothetical protein